MDTLQDLKIVAHHTLQDIIKIIMPEGAPEVISRSRLSVIFQCCLQMLASMLVAFLHSPSTFKTEAITPVLLFLLKFVKRFQHINTDTCYTEK